MIKRSLILPAMAAGLLLPMTPPLVGLAKPAIIKPAKDWAAHEKMLLASFLPGMVPSFNRAVAGVAGATWNNSDKAAAITLSGSDLVATDGSNGWSGVRTVVSKNSGKYYVEFTNTAMPTVAGCWYGLANGSFSLTASAGFDANNTVVAEDQFGIFHMNNTSPGPRIGQYNVVGSIISFAWDLTSKKVWGRVDGGAWNNNGANAPDGSGGFDFSTLNAGPYFLLFQPYYNGTVCTLNTGPTFAYTPPSGYGIFG